MRELNFQINTSLLINADWIQTRTFDTSDATRRNSRCIACICIRNARETYARNLKMTTIRSKDQISNIKMLRDIWEFCTTSHVSAQYIVIDFPKISRSRIIKHTSETQRIQYKTTFYYSIEISRVSTAVESRRFASKRISNSSHKHVPSKSRAKSINYIPNSR